jgi:Protein of unknown function (DUF3306)
MAAEENFLTRWSRRKHERRREESSPAPAADQPAAGAAAAAPAAPPAHNPRPVPRPAPELPPVDTLKGLASDYQEFLRPGIDEGVRRAALKKLFHDPHFNVMDGLDVYIDDYSKPDPIPESMLKQLLERHHALTERPEADSEERAETPAAIADSGNVEAIPPAQPDSGAPGGDESKPS